MCYYENKTQHEFWTCSYQSLDTSKLPLNKWITKVNSLQWKPLCSRNDTGSRKLQNSEDVSIRLHTLWKLGNHVKSIWIPSLSPPSIWMMMEDAIISKSELHFKQ